MIGETAEIGDRVTLYQGVTLGGTGFARGKRHPTVEDDVTIGSGREAAGAGDGGARREGRGEHGRGGGRPAEVDGGRQPGPHRPGRGRRPEGPDADWIHLPDPIADAIRSLSDRLAAAERRLAEIDGNAAEAEVKELKPKQGPSSAGG